MQKGHLVTFLLSPLEKDELFLKIQIIDSYWWGGWLKTIQQFQKLLTFWLNPGKKQAKLKNLPNKSIIY